MPTFWLLSMYMAAVELVAKPSLFAAGRYMPLTAAVEEVTVTEDAEATPSVGVTKVGEVVIATLPEPLTVYSPSVPALSYSTLVVVPLAMALVPTVRLAAGAAQVPSPRQ